MKRIRMNKQERGFTILELMIATTVLAVILVLVSAMMIGIGNLYYKGVNQARVQDTTRTVVDDLAQHLQLSDSGPRAETTAVTVGGVGGYTLKAYCVDNTRYSYVINKQIGTDVSKGQIPHVLWRDDVPASGCDPADLSQPVPSAGGTEMIVANSRLTAFSISIASPYTISIGVALGDTDLLNFNGINTTCQGSLGQQYCATANLTTVVVQRITNS